MKQITIFQPDTVEESHDGIPSNTSKVFETGVIGTGQSLVDFSDIVSPSGDFKKLSGIKVVINSLRNLLATPLGSYPFDPEYGSELYKQLFEPADEITAEEIKHTVIDNARQFDDRIEITNVDTAFFSNRKGFRISVTIKRADIDEKIDIDITEQESAFELE